MLTEIEVLLILLFAVDIEVHLNKLECREKVHFFL